MLTKSKFRPAWWLRNPHLQTLWAAKIQPAPTPHVTYERVTTPDDDFVDLCWSEANQGPLVIIFHGLTGSFKSRYIRALMASLKTQHIDSVLMHFRGCSGEPNRTAGAYHSGHTADIEHIIATMHQRFPERQLIAVGFSLGANALLKYLATTPTPLSYAIAVCPPLVLAEGADRINRGFSRVYERTLIKQMRRAMQAKQQRYPQLGLAQYDVAAHDNFVDWDHHITAPLHGYQSGKDYYERASTLSDLNRIGTKTHLISSVDDPFFTPRCVPQSEAQLSKQVTIELVSGAGHVGFISGNIPLCGKDWLRQRLTSLITMQMAATG